MKTLEEPPYLTVGTDVSAKYRGAFCEAKIKTAKRLVKAKVTFKSDLSTAEVHDESIKGPLKVGAIVEVKNQDGVYQEATINKLTDASIYTVVFDDGDEKTLRRSSLCLKGARHFAESETLDRLPLTNPEHFGTPVIGKKGNRGRRSNPIQEEDLSSSSSEDEESDQRQNADLFGKVVCVEGVAIGDKKKTTWYPALVTSPDCHDDITMKKESLFVRSFKDGKFYMVLRKDVREIDTDCPPKADAGLKPVLDAALEFQQQLVIPSTWKTEVKEESSSSEVDDDDEEEEQEEDASGEEEEEEVEPYPEERENFLQQLYKFMEDRRTPINKRPVLGYRNLNLFKLYRLVNKLGGFDNIESGAVWKQIYQDLGIPVLNSAAGYNVKCAYRKYLYGFEEYCTSTAITFKMDLPLKQAPKGEVTSAVEGGIAAPTSSSPEERKDHGDGEPIGAQSVVCKEETLESVLNKSQCTSSKAEGKDSNGSNTYDDDEEEEEDEDSSPHTEDADEGSSTSRLGAESIKQEQDEDQESKSGDDNSQEGEEGEEFECYPPGMKVQVRYGRGRSLKTYEATVKEADVEGGEVLYLVHYCGWNIRYDEWIKADKIVRPANKNVPKIKHRKKIKNKAERERDRLERLNDRDVLGPSSNRVPRSKCDLGQDVFSKLDQGEDQGTQQHSPAKSIEITSILNGLQASELSSDESDHESEGEHNKEDRDTCEGTSELQKTSEWRDSGTPPNGSKPSAVLGKNLEIISGEVGKRKPDLIGEASTRKRKSDGAVERTPKKQSKAKRATRSADWLPAGSSRKLDERSAGAMDERGASSSSSSDDEGAGSQAEGSERAHPKSKGSPSKKYNGTKEKSKSSRQAGFWDIPEKRAKMSGNGEDKPAVRSKGQKDVWSSIQAQWPKKTLKELFSDSDTEAANSPPPPVPSSLEDTSVEQEAGPEDDASEEHIENDKLQEFPSSGSNSVLNTPPTTPESPSGRGSALEDCGPAPAPSPPAPPTPPGLPPASTSASLLPGLAQEEVACRRSESDSSTVEVESLGGELPDLPRDDGTGSPPKVFDAPLSSNSSSSCSLELSSSSQHESEQKSKASVSQKRQKESQTGGVSKKHKPNRKSLGVPPKKNRKTANSSDSEDQSLAEGSAKPAATKNDTSDVKVAVSPKCRGRSPPSSHKYHKQGDGDHSQHRENHGRSPRVYKWSFQMSDLEKMSSLERISFLQDKLQDIRNHYLSLKSEVASIDRRRKRMKKKELESTVAASSSSSSSSPSSSSLTAAVMLTLADQPVSSSSSSSQNSGLSVECR
ncbi:AT-rich interactive domain-containing protein 4B isoform X1 [Festucalex cinctus]